MKKIIVRIVAVVMLAVMVLTALPAFASGFVGTIAQETNLYEKARTSSDVVAKIKGTVTIHYQNNEGTMYQVSIANNGTTYTGWVAASAVSNIGRSGSSSSSVSSGSSSSSSTATRGTYSGYLSSTTNIYNDKNKLAGSVRGSVTVNSRNAAGDQVNITASDGINSVTGWVAASAISNLYSRSSGSITIKDLPTSGAGVAATGSYTAYNPAKTGVSTDRTIYVRPTASKSTSGATKIRDAKGLTFNILGESGDYYYASYGTATGFVRKQDFTITAGTANNNNTNTNTNTNATTNNGSPSPTTTYSQAKAATSTDSTIYMRVKPDKSTSSSNVVVKVTSARGANFSLLGESGDWYYAEYTKGGTPYRGYVRKQDFNLTSANTNANTNNAPIQGAVSNSTSTSGATQVGSGSSSEKWGSFSVPGGSTYTIYGNYTNKAGNLYYYDYSNIKSYKYLHTTTAKNSQIQVVMGHNMRDSKTMFHRLHHVQNAILGKSSCEGCGNSCSSAYTTTISASLDGYSKWDILCFYEIPKGSSTSILEFNARPWNTSTSNYLSTQLNYANQSGLKGWVNPNVSASSNGKYMMLITCGDKYESSSNATSKLYMLLKARG